MNYHQEKYLRPLLLLLCCVISTTPFSLPQAGQTKDQLPRQRELPTFRVASNLVVVDVTVRDKKGKAIRDLTRENFKIFEDNVPQEIVTFSQESIPISREESVAEEQPKAKVPQPAAVNFNSTLPAQIKREDVQDKRLIILYFDLSSLANDPEDLIHSVSAAENYVGKRSTSQDLVALATYESTLQLVQDFTNDRDVLLTALKKLNPSEASDTVTEDLGDTDTSGEVYVPDDVQFNIFNTDRRLSSIDTLAKMYRDLPERKSLIYFSSGFTTTGSENDSQIRYTVDSANRSNMTIYTVDSRGLVALPPGGGAKSASPGGRALFSGDAMSRQTANLTASQETLTTLAHDTGG